MLQRVRRTSFAAAVCLLLLLLSAAAEGSAMNHQLRASAAVPLDFLQWIERDAGWLRQALAERGATTGYSIADGRLEARTIEALRQANRIRSFAYLAAPGLRPPYFDLTVREAAGQPVRCVTLFPRSIAPQLGALDFDREWFPAADADPAILAMCRVDPAAASEYAQLDRDAFRARYFDAHGDLRGEFAELNTAAAFIARAIDLGFFVLQEDYTGRLRLDNE